METSFQNTAGLFWPNGAMTETSHDSNAVQPRDALDSIIQALSEIVGTVVGPQDKRVDEKDPKPLFDSNGAPNLLSKDEPSTEPLVIPTPINLGAVVSETQKIGTEAGNALVNRDSNRAADQMRATVNKTVDAQLNSVKEFEKKSAELDEKAGRWYNRLISWVSENLGPYMPYIAVGIAVVATAATGGAAWPMLAMAGLSLANQVLQKYDINVVEEVTKAINTVGALVSEKGAAALAHTVGSVVGVLLSDPTPISKLFGVIAKAAGASKATIEKAEQWGQIVGMVVIVGANLVMTWGAGAANAVTKAASNATNAVGSTATKAASFVADALKAFLRNIEPYVSRLIQIIRESAGRINELSTLFNEVMQGARGAATGAASSLKNAAVAWQPYLDLGAKAGQTALNGTNGTVGVGNGYREVELAGVQRDIESTAAERRKLDEMVAISRDHMEDTDDVTRRAMDRVGQNLKTVADMVLSYTRGGNERAAIQKEQMTA